LAGGNEMEFTLIDLAEQQILGYKHAKEGYDLISLIAAMGLTKAEWETLKETYTLRLTFDEVIEINEYFFRQK